MVNMGVAGASGPIVGGTTPLGRWPSPSRSGRGACDGLACPASMRLGWHAGGGRPSRDIGVVGSGGVENHDDDAGQSRRP